jgi:Family of unknown function (DUF5995)
MCLLVALAAAGAASARTEGTDLFPWPEALPPSQVPNDAQGRAVEHCRRPGPSCVHGLRRRLRRQFERFDATCDHRAVIAYSYLQITRGLLADMRGPRPGLVRHRRWMAYLITNFSNRYFRAFRRHARGLAVTPAWEITFETAARANAQAGQEVLLFSNVHVQHDLPFAYEKLGIETRSGRSRKPDHDAVNEINARVFDRIEDYLAAHYDPSFSLVDTPFVPVEEIGALELVKLWREGAWRSAERLLAAGTAAERAAVATTIRETATRWAEAISAPGFPGYRATRDAYCAAH